MVYESTECHVCKSIQVRILVECFILIKGEIFLRLLIWLIIVCQIIFGIILDTKIPRHTNIGLPEYSNVRIKAHIMSNPIQSKSTFQVSGFSVEPANIIGTPVIMFNTNTNATRFENDEDQEEIV